jgi:hypothetical protein
MEPVINEFNLSFVSRYIFRTGACQTASLPSLKQSDKMFQRNASANAFFVFTRRCSSPCRSQSGSSLGGQDCTICLFWRPTASVCSLTSSDGSVRFIQICIGSTLFNEGGRAYSLTRSCVVSSSVAGTSMVQLVRGSLIESLDRGSNPQPVGAPHV